MSDPLATTSRSSRVIKAPREKIFRAFTSADAIAAWQAPEGMTARVHEFRPGIGGGYEMSLFYPPSEHTFRGKTAEREDRFTAKFVDFDAPSRIVQAVRFETADPEFEGEIRMTVELEDLGDETAVTVSFENLPRGIRPEDNDAGTRSSLAKLARYVEQQER